MCIQADFVVIPDQKEYPHPEEEEEDVSEEALKVNATLLQVCLVSSYVSVSQCRACSI